MWKFKNSGVEGNCELNGVNIFDYKWERTKEKIKVSDPLYGQEHTMDVYYANINNKKVKFAAGEFSNLIYGFYMEE
jgi:hypothetical protein